jgi:hypothetical protein
VAAGVVEAEAAGAAEAAGSAAGAAEAAEAVVACGAAGGEAAVAAARPGGLAAGARLRLIDVRRPRVGMAGVERLGRGVWGSARQLRASRPNG